MAEVFCNQTYGTLSNAFKIKQGTLYTIDLPVTALGAHLNAIEDFNPNIQQSIDPFRWIPEGIYYDLFDLRNESTPVIDNVSGYTNAQFFNALDNDVKSMPQFRSRLLSENGNNQSIQVIALFGQYNY